MKFLRDEGPFIPFDKWRKVCLATCIITLTLYIAAMISSLLGSSYFILKYQNDSMDSIQSFLKSRNIYSLTSCMFLTFEISIISSFVSNKIIKLWYPLIIYVLYISIAFLIPSLPTSFYTILGFATCLIVPLIDSFINRTFSYKIFIRYAIGIATSLILQVIIYIIKAGYFSTENHIMNLSAHFIYSIEYDIALSVILYTVLLYIDKEKGDSQQWATYHSHSGSSQISKTKSYKSSLKKNLTKKQRTKLFFLWVRLYAIQVIGFAFLMIIPFLLGKVLEFLIMYLSFALIRYILGFKYSLHFQNEILCLSVGAVVFGILSLAVPFFYIEIIIAILLGVSLAVFLHLSYKYKSFWLFAKMAKPDKYAILYTLFNENLDEKYILRTCKHTGMSLQECHIVYDYMAGEKISYIAHKYNYSVKSIDRILSDAIDLLNM